ncbi:helix-turn-helix domain-containing protein [Lysobacter yangpyeongensis]|uniref:Helix-turn-helix domain-containing protein n=1 Tax=Lysobacter yangpyeongensis TaxID=346182 RepID=A0ABW0SPK1_9GAMM
MEPATLQMKLGTAIRARRIALGFSQDSFADRIRMHRAYYSAIERGERNVTLHTVYRVAQGLLTSVADLMADARL